MTDNDRSYARSWLVEILSWIFFAFRLSAYEAFIYLIKYFGCRKEKNDIKFLDRWKEKDQWGWVTEIYAVINILLALIAFFTYPAIA